MSRALPLAGFQVTFIGRFWVITEAFRNMRAEFIDERAAVAKGIRLSNGACIELARSLGLVRLPTAHSTNQGCCRRFR